MGTEGMKYSLVSREVIADSIETVCKAQSLDGVLAVGGCDKNMPGAMIAIARMNIRSEEHTSELQSPCNLVCRLLLEKKKKTNTTYAMNISQLTTAL